MIPGAQRTHATDRWTVAVVRAARCVDRWLRRAAALPAAALERSLVRLGQLSPSRGRALYRKREKGGKREVSCSVCWVATRKMAVEFSQGRAGAILAECAVLNLTPPSKIGTGICFLDHMIDQFTSHGMLGVTLRCGVVGEAAEAGGAEPEPETAGSQAKFFAPLKDYATGMSGRPHDRDIFAACGTAIGLALRRVVNEVTAAGGSAPVNSSAVFCSPLDESFTEASVDLQPPDAQCGQCVTALEPYGIHTGNATGRRWIGRYRTELTPVFWTSLAEALQVRTADL